MRQLHFYIYNINAIVDGLDVISLELLKTTDMQLYFQRLQSLKCELGSSLTQYKFEINLLIDDKYKY